MWDMNDLVKITYKHDYIFYIEFDNGVAGDIDFHEYIDRGSVFAPLRVKKFFKSATIEGGTISWPNGADIAPETLFKKVYQQI